MSLDLAAIRLCEEISPEMPFAGGSSSIEAARCCDFLWVEQAEETETGWRWIWQSCLDWETAKTLRLKRGSESTEAAGFWEIGDSSRVSLSLDRTRIPDGDSIIALDLLSNEGRDLGRLYLIRGSAARKTKEQPLRFQTGLPLLSAGPVSTGEATATGVRPLKLLDSYLQGTLQVPDGIRDDDCWIQSEAAEFQVDGGWSSTSPLPQQGNETDGFAFRVSVAALQPGWNTVVFRAGRGRGERLVILGTSRLLVLKAPAAGETSQPLFLGGGLPERSRPEAITTRSLWVFNPWRGRMRARPVGLSFPVGLVPLSKVAVAFSDINLRKSRLAAHGVGMLRIGIESGDRSRGIKGSIALEVGAKKTEVLVDLAFEGGIKRVLPEVGKPAGTER